ncbi:hypothetical protein CTAM01_15639 [Colletotrichum tamarilloi]|uniref:Uncharacterized protein n=1 Tax=Colletotrichum tamarilloi TaxID=1209934 RepID=A0ABQ9QKV5_9PEZI|nr:hypothetical protein CTAM01_15639 [Colletotrichum tamarilloi]
MGKVNISVCYQLFFLHFFFRCRSLSLRG